VSINPSSSILFDRYSSEHGEAVPIQKPKTEGVPRAIKTISEQQERGFSAKKYLIAAFVCAAIAGALFAFCLPASIVFMTISGWYLWSALVIPLNRAAEGTRFETPLHRCFAFAMEINSLVTAALLFPLTWLNQYHRPPGALKGRPILMVNGYLSYGSTWDYQRKELAKKGLGPIYTMNVGSGKSITSYAEQVRNTVNRIKQETGRNDVVLIGHSKGGLVCSDYATRLANQDGTRITDVVTIGSPLAGTPVAFIGPGYDAGEMRPNTVFNQQLRDNIKKHPEIRFFNIASQADEVVPFKSALIKGNDPSRQLILKDLGHLSLVFSSRVADQTASWLMERGWSFNNSKIGLILSRVYDLLVF